MERSYISSTRNVDTARLWGMLRGKFGRGGYRVEMRHGTYTIYARQKLTEVNKTENKLLITTLLTLYVIL